MTKINKTFWNHYLIHPCEKKSNKSCTRYLIASIALGVITLGIPHLVIFLKVRVSKKPPETQPTNRVGNQVLQPAPELPLPAMDEYHPSEEHLKRIKKFWKEIPANPGKPIPYLAFAKHILDLPPAGQMKSLMSSFRERTDDHFSSFEKARAVVAEFRQRPAPANKEEREQTDHAFMQHYVRMNSMQSQVHYAGVAIYQIVLDNPNLDFKAETQEVQQHWTRIQNQTACYWEAFSWLNAKGFIRRND